MGIIADSLIAGRWTKPTTKKPVVVQDPLAATPVTNAIPGQPQTNTVAPQPGAVRTITDPMAGTVAPVVMPQTVNNNVQPQQVQNAVQPTVTDPMAVAPVTASQGFGTTVSNQVQTPPVGNTGGTQPRPSLFGNTAIGIGDAYTGTLRDALTGKIYDPMAAGTKEAMARAEANRRASMANQIAGAGFSGTGIGQQIAGGLEGDMSKQRYDTMIGIEQARNQGRVSALGEARAYGTAEEGIRQYEKDFGEGARRFDIGQSNWERGFDEDRRRYDQDFAEDKERYGDTQEWKAYEEAMRNGSDADVISAYKAATGKDLDPAAVSQYRGYYRRGQEQGLEAGDVAIATARQTLGTMKKTEAGNDLANYLATHLDSDMSDPALGPMMQKYWESLGNTGPVPKDWADQQIRAARDVRINTEIGAFNYQIDQLVASGQMKPEDAALLKDFNSGGMTQFLVRDPATGKVKFDATAYLASVSGGTSGGTVAPGTSTIKGVNVTTPEGKEEGDIFEKDGKVYRVDMDGNPEAVAMKDLTWDDIKGQGLTTDSAAYKAVVKNAEPMDLQYKSSILTDSWKIAPEVGETRRATVGGKDVLLKVTFKGTQDVKMGFDNAYIEFEDLDGNKYYAGGPTKSTEIKAGTARGTTNGNIVNAAIGSTPTGNKIVDTTINTVIPGRGIISAGKKIWDWMT